MLTREPNVGSLVGILELRILDANRLQKKTELSNCSTLLSLSLFYPRHPNGEPYDPPEPVR
jgi:hypothetical protein